METENSAYLAKLKTAIEKNWDDQMQTLREIIAIRSVDEGPAAIRREKGLFGDELAALAKRYDHRVRGKIDLAKLRDDTQKLVNR